MFSSYRRCLANELKETTYDTRLFVVSFDSLETRAKVERHLPLALIVRLVREFLGLPTRSSQVAHRPRDRGRLDGE
jgi:hypothetical protein